MKIKKEIITNTELLIGAIIGLGLLILLSTFGSFVAITVYNLYFA